MEWNLRPSSMWEWENLFEFEPKANENPNPKKLLLQQQQDRADFSVEEAERGGISSGGSLHSPGETGGSGSDLGHASSKSSVSASINSSSFGESRATSNNNKFTLDGFEPATKAKQQPEISAGSGEPFLSLKLGKRMYYKEDIYSESSAVAAKKPSSSSATAAAAKRTKSASQSAQSPRCQVEGCNLDLSSAKDYHRKHRICESHSKSPRVIVGGIERRFCQQCSRFHGLSEFDENKRSCRRRLSDHNARRRKPQPQAVRLNPARFSSIYDEPQKMSLVFEQAPQRLAWPNFSWNHGAADGSNKSGHTKEYLSGPVKNAQGQILLASNEIPGSNIAMLYHNNPTRLTPNKSTAAPEFLHSGIEESVVSSELNTTQDLHRALSLLSTSSWSTRETTKPAVSHNATGSALNNNNNNVVLNQGLVMPIGSSSLAEFWQTQHAAPIETEPRTNANANANANGHFQDLHLFKPPPTDSGLYPYHF